MPTVLVSRRVVLGPSSSGDAARSLRVVPAAITIEGSTIAAVVELADASDYVAPEGAEVVDFGDKLLAPTFINPHTHLALGFLRGLDMRAVARGNMVEEFFFQVERRVSPEDVRAFARIGAYDSLLAGVGFVWEHYYVGEHVAEGLVDVGLAGVVAPTLQDISGPGKDAWEAQLEATARIDESNRLRAHGVFAALGPHATDTVSATLFDKALELAEARQLPLHAHLAQSIEEYRRAQQRHGVSPTEWLGRIGVLERSPQNVFAHAIYVDRTDLARLAASRSANVYCPYSQLIFGFPAPAGEWSRAGVSWGIATDCASNNDTMNVQKELRFAAGHRTVGTTWSEEYQRFLGGDATAAEATWQRRVALSAAHEDDAAPSRLLSRIWSEPGGWHPKARVGMLEAGALANVLVLDLENPAVWPAHDPLQALAMADTAPAIWAMYVAGRRIGTPGAFHESILRSAEYREAHREAQARLTRLDLTV
jgi:5-methylthioadenosine/S-adenosylhomocysteine deaminase